MVEFSKVNIKDFEDDDEEEEAGEEVESAPPLEVGQEREISSNGLKKMLIKRGLNWETPQFGDEVTIHYVASLLDGSKFLSTRASNKPITLKVGHGDIVHGLDRGIVTMTKGEISMFTLPPEIAYGAVGMKGVPPNSIVQFEVELLSWTTVVDIFRDGGIIKRVLENGEQIGPPGDLDEVRVKYKAMLSDDTVVAKTPEEGVEFYVKDGNFCPALAKAEKAPREMSAPERIETAGRMKEEGNQLFRSGKYQRALKKYEKAVDYASQDGNFTDEDEKILKPLRVSCWLNCAACCLKQNNFVQTISLCSKILDIESCNVKALYRRAQAYIGVSELISAEADIKKALEVDPQERDVKLLQKNLKQLEMESNKRDAKLYKAMFSKRTSDENPARAKRLKTAEDDIQYENVAATINDNVAINSAET
ncbi:peptidyl-prolyl cis-trans isomerase FKBP62 [Striga asiatica]|uniref:peptidylprolyl isomerase n=1 Tax=Striga asiatica TaxID=4170 RepID=A0A5A7PEY8_STRAF|nr:peptidyl-prolyl cis-trans isomerase FKBP62 [Striga asiatica]